MSCITKPHWLKWIHMSNSVCLSVCSPACWSSVILSLGKRPHSSASISRWNGNVTTPWSQWRWVKHVCLSCVCVLYEFFCAEHWWCSPSRRFDLRFCLVPPGEWVAVMLQIKPVSMVFSEPFVADRLQKDISGSECVCLYMNTTQPETKTYSTHACDSETCLTCSYQAD